MSQKEKKSMWGGGGSLKEGTRDPLIHTFYQYILFCFLDHYYLVLHQAPALSSLSFLITQVVLDVGSISSSRPSAKSDIAWLLPEFCATTALTCLAGRTLLQITAFVAGLVFMILFLQSTFLYQKQRSEVSAQVSTQHLHVH